MKLLYLAKDEIEANLIKLQLSEFHINTSLRGINLHMGIGELPVDANFIKIFVKDKHYQKAYMYIEKYKKDISSTNKIDWKCDNCNELIYSTLTSCWNCGNERKIKEL